MNPQDDLGTAIELEQVPVLAAAAKPTAAVAGMPYAVPADGFVAHPNVFVEAVYRVCEIALAAVGLVILLPLLLFQAIVICLDSPGPPLFFHRRPARSVKVRGRELVGRCDVRPPPGGYDPDAFYYVPTYFRFVKFRTMYRDAKARWPELYDYTFAPEEFHLRCFKQEVDPRITRVGLVLRRLTLDELPNLWCVLIGRMRLVGPRPELPDALQYYSPDEMYKFAVKPGITGLAQINGRGLLNWGDTLAWDLQYVRTQSLWLDLRIMLITLKYIMTRRGAF